MTSRAPTPLSIPIALALAVAASPAAAQGPRVALQDGDVVVNVFDQFGSAIEILDPTGAQLAYFTTGTGQYWEGAAIDASGRLVTTRRIPVGVDVFDASGTEVFTFDTPAVGTFAGDVSLFADGTYAISDQSGDVELYDPFGTHVGTYSHPLLVVPFGSSVDRCDDTLWVASSDPALATVGAVVQFDRLGTVLNAIPTAWRVGDVVPSAAGTIWVTDRTADRVVELDYVGNELRAHALPTGGFSAAGISIAPDGTILATSVSSKELYRLDATLGVLSSTPVAATGVPVFLAVVDVPGMMATPAQISVSTGGSQLMTVDLGTRNAGLTYLVLGSVTGTTPGTAYGSVTVPLNLDPYFLFTLSSPNRAPLTASLGVLNSLGTATVVFALPGASDPSLAGLALHHAAMAIDLAAPLPTLVEATEAVALGLLP